jgi:hypothetical protein
MTQMKFIRKAKDIIHICRVSGRLQAGRMFMDDDFGKR